MSFKKKSPLKLKMNLRKPCANTTILQYYNFISLFVGTVFI